MSVALPTDLDLFVLRIQGCCVMSATVSQTTAEQLAALPDDGRRHELVEGELRMMTPAGNEHGQIASRLAWRVARVVEENGLGATFAAETGFLIGRDPDTVRAPDFAFVSQQRLDEMGVVRGFWPGAPDIAAEVVSPSDSFSGVEEKALGWLDAGSRVVWVVDPRQRHVTVYRSPEDITILDADARLDAPDLLPDWYVCVGDLFPS